MQELFSSFIPGSDAAPLPEEMVDEAEALARTVSTSVDADAALKRLIPMMKEHAANCSFIMSCALLVEKLRQTEGMLEFWEDVVRLCPDNALAFRLLMRWHRRLRRNEECLDRIERRFPDRLTMNKQTVGALDALEELQKFDRIDALMEEVLRTQQNPRVAVIRYVKVLTKQMRFREAAQNAARVPNRDELGATSREVLEIAERRSAALDEYSVESSDQTIGRIIDQIPLPQRPPPTKDNLGKILMFSGQLGPGGAERQMTRIASELQARFKDAGTVDDYRLTAPPEVCVKHANANTGHDFYLPFLRDAGLAVSIVNEMPANTIESLGLPTGITELLEFLPGDLVQQTCKLVPYFNETRPQIAYLWQDGGVTSASMAALIAGVPRIVTSFRGMPPNLRPEFLRRETPSLFSRLAALPHVTFTANSLKNARSYEDWLNLSRGTVKVLYNATYLLSDDGDKDDQRLWQKIKAASPECDRTVVGVFRYKANKRPIEWVETAATFLKNRPNTRFVMIGDGDEYNNCRKLIEENGLEDRIFQTGLRRNVGFFINRSDLLMHLAINEGLPNVIVEAQMTGKPVIATPAGGTAEVVEDGLTGQILSDAAILPREELQRGLASILDDDDRLKRLGAEAKRYASDKFNVETIVKQTLDLMVNG